MKNKTEHIFIWDAFSVWYLKVPFHPLTLPDAPLTLLRLTTMLGCSPIWTPFKSHLILTPQLWATMAFWCRNPLHNFTVKLFRWVWGGKKIAFKQKSKQKPSFIVKAITYLKILWSFHVSSNWNKINLHNSSLDSLFSLLKVLLKTCIKFLNACNYLLRLLKSTVFT